MKYPRGLCLAAVVLTLFSITIVITVLCVTFSQADPTEYPIIIPKGEQDYDYINATDFDWDNGFKSCGAPMDSCPPLNESESEQSPNATKTRKPIYFMKNSNFCRCDRKCLKYGDCCTTILKQIRKIPANNYWRCVKLLNTGNSVRMISRCPYYYPDDMNRALCENNGSYPDKEFYSKYAASLLPLLDVPVVRNDDLFLNIFCARCHSVSNHDIKVINHTLHCSNFSSMRAFEDFQNRAVYQRGKLQWIDPSNSSQHCRLSFPELNRIHTLVPDVRFCISDAREECSLDVDSNEDNEIISNLCFSYTQIVQYKDSNSNLKIYKNPHCAKCDNPYVNITRTPICVRSRARPMEDTFASLGTRRFIDQESSINVLFHFSSPYVGFTSKCDDEEEVFDFIRSKCVFPLEKEVLTDNYSNNETTDLSQMMNSSEPCFLIILNAGEYQLMPNATLVVNLTSNSSLLTFKPGEYRQYNGSSMSICADLGQTYYSTFNPYLGYLSRVALTCSVLCCMLHIVQYYLIPKNMNTLHRKNLFCLVLSLLIYQLIFLTLINTKNTTICQITAVVLHYMLLSMFFWNFILSLDVWLTFRKEFITRRNHSFKTFLKYSLFAWVGPLLIVMSGLILDFGLPESIMEFSPVLKKLRPSYGKNNLCWITQRVSLLVFFALPVALLILINALFFIFTSCKIFDIHREGKRIMKGGGSNGTSSNGNSKFKASAAADSSSQQSTTGSNGAAGINKAPLRGCNSTSTKSKSDEIKIVLYVKLALIMGVTWILGFLSAITEWEVLHYIFVTVNGLTGTWIYFAFDFSNTVALVREKCGLKKKKSGKGESSGDDSSAIKRRGTNTLSSTLESSSRTESSIRNETQKQIQMNHCVES